MRLMTFMNNLFRNSKSLGSQKVWHSKRSLLYIKVVGVFQEKYITVKKGDYQVSGFSFLHPFVGDSANKSSVRWSGDKVLLSTIRHPFYPRRQTPLESRSTNGEGEFVLRKL